MCKIFWRLNRCNLRCCRAGKVVGLGTESDAEYQEASPDRRHISETKPRDSVWPIPGAGKHSAPARAGQRTDCDRNHNSFSLALLTRNPGAWGLATLQRRCSPAMGEGAAGVMGESLQDLGDFVVAGLVLRIGATTRGQGGPPAGYPRVNISTRMPATRSDVAARTAPNFFTRRVWSTVRIWSSAAWPVFPWKWMPMRVG